MVSFADVRSVLVFVFYSCSPKDINILSPQTILQNKQYLHSGEDFGILSYTKKCSLTPLLNSSPSVKTFCSNHLALWIISV